MLVISNNPNTQFRAYMWSSRQTPDLVRQGEDDFEVYLPSQMYNLKCFCQYGTVAGDTKFYLHSIPLRVKLGGRLDFPPAHSTLVSSTGGVHIKLISTANHLALYEVIV